MRGLCAHVYKCVNRCLREAAERVPVMTCGQQACCVFLGPWAGGGVDKRQPRCLITAVVVTPSPSELQFPFMDIARCERQSHPRFTYSFSMCVLRADSASGPEDSAIISGPLLGIFSPRRGGQTKSANECPV